MKAVKRVLEEIQIWKSRKSQLQEALVQEKKRIKALYIPKRSKVSLEDVLTVEERVRELFLKNNYPECGTLSGKMLQERVVDIFQKLEWEKNELENNISNKKAERDAILFQNLAEQQQECHNQLAALENDTARWKQMILFWENVSEWEVGS